MKFVNLAWQITYSNYNGNCEFHNVISLSNLPNPGSGLWCSFTRATNCSGLHTTREFRPLDSEHDQACYTVHKFSSPQLINFNFYTHSLCGVSFVSFAKMNPCNKFTGTSHQRLYEKLLNVIYILNYNKILTPSFICNYN